MVTASVSVAVEMESRPGRGRWAGPVWRAVAVRPGRRGAADWTILSREGEKVRYHAGTAPLVMRASETGRYGDNLGARVPSVYVVLRRDAGSPTGLRLHLVTVDPDEAEAHVGVGEDLVEAVPMPDGLRDWLAAFVASHHVERPFWKRQRDAKVPGASAGDLAGDPAPEAVPEEGGFLARWSNRKRAGADALEGGEHAARGEPPPALQPEDGTAEERIVPAGDGAPEPDPSAPAEPATVDLGTLETLRTREDFAAFLRGENLAPVLRLAALRRAWRLDPAIAGHRPLVDYDWNVNAPGYGRLLPEDAPEALIEKLFGHLKRAAQAEDDAPAPDAEGVAAAPDPAAPPEPAPAPAATGHVEPAAGTEPPRPAAADQPAERADLPPRRRHGGAAPA